MSDYQRLKDWIGFKGTELNKWLVSHRHLTWETRLAKWDAVCAELNPIACDLKAYEEAVAKRKDFLQTQEYRGLQP